MSKDRLNELKEELKLAKEANELTVENIGKIVSDATRSIVKELKHDKDMTADALKGVLGTTTDSLEEFGELTADNIKAGRDGVEKVLKDEMDFHMKKFEELHHTLADEWPEDMKMVFSEVKDDAKKALHNFKEFGELLLDSVHLP